MKTFDGYSKEKFSDTSVLLAGGGSKELSNFIGTLNWDSTNRKLQYKKIGDTNWSDLATFGSNALNSTSYLPLTGGAINGNLIVNGNTTFKGSTSSAIVTDGDSNIVFDTLNNIVYTGDTSLLLATFRNGGNIYGQLTAIPNEETGLYYNNYRLLTNLDFTNPRTTNVTSLGDASSYWTGVYSQGFYKNGSSDDYVLLGGGGHKLISDLATAGNSSITIPTCSTLDENSNVFKVEYIPGSININTRPSGVDAFGVIKLRTATGWYGQILMSSNKATGIYYRTAQNLNSSASWTKLLDSSNYTTFINFQGAAFRSGGQSDQEHNCNNATANGHYYYTTNGPSGLGEQSTDGSLYVQSWSSVWVSQIAQDYRNGNLWVRSRNNNNWQPWRIVCSLDTSKNLTIGGSFYANSDIRYKLIQSYLLNKVNSIAELPIFTYYWNDNQHDNKLHIGSSAQAVKEILPELVTYDESKDFYNLDYATLGTIAGITACKELVNQKSEIDLLKERVKELEQQLKMINAYGKFNSD